MNDRDQLLSRAEVAAEFQVSGKTVWNWAKAGLLPSVKNPSGRRRYRREDVDRLLRDEQVS